MFLSSLPLALLLLLFLWRFFSVRLFVSSFSLLFLTLTAPLSLPPLSNPNNRARETSSRGSTRPSPGRSRAPSAAPSSRPLRGTPRRPRGGPPSRGPWARSPRRSRRGGSWPTTRGSRWCLRCRCCGSAKGASEEEEWTSGGEWIKGKRRRRRRRRRRMRERECKVEKRGSR